jgi:hypothetical protein
LPYSKLW